MALTTRQSRRFNTQGLQSRLLIATWLVALAFLVLISRLYALQILRGEELADKGRENYVQRVEVQHDRGIIYDRYGRILVDNRPSLNLTVTPHFLGGADRAGHSLARVGSLLGIDGLALSRVQEAVFAKRGLERFRPITVAKDLDPQQVEAIEADRSVFLLDGVSIVEGRRRTYRYGSAAAHLLGYVNEIDRYQLDREIKRGNPHGYERGDRLGRQGIEHRYEAELRGTDGWEKVVVDAKGRRLHGEYVDALIGDKRRHDPVPGNNVFLTIDLDLQNAAEHAFDGRAGAAVAIDPRDGSILAIVSRPAFDPNLISGTLATAEKARLDSDPLKPWVNRAIQGQYAPGSTFKVVTALALLNTKTASPEDKVKCPGYYRLGRRAWRCHKDSGHGLVDLKAALKVSCDTYFYAMAHRMGIDAIAEAGTQFGFGVKTGLRLRGEKGGLMPTEAFHDRVEASTGGYQKGMALNTAIGQGSVLLTPLQLGVAYAAIAADGMRRVPRTVARVETADFRVLRRTLLDGKIGDEVTGTPPEVVEPGDPVEETKMQADLETWQSIQTGLIAVAQEPGGTAFRRRSQQVLMTGKTGTAQVIRLGRERLKADEMQFEDRDHAWFAGYAPIEAPEIVVAVLNEHSGHGGAKAEPIAVRIIDAYFDLAARRAPRASVGESP